MTKEAPQSQPERTPAVHTNTSTTNTNAAPVTSFDMAMLQRTVGNQAVQRMIQRKHGEKEGAPKGVATGWFSKMLATVLFGSEEDRTKAPEEGGTAAVAKATLEDTIASWDRVSVASGPNTLAGTLYKPKTGLTGTGVLLLSGSGGSSSAYMPEVAKAYVEMGDAVLMMDYRGFGRSKKKTDAPQGSDTPSEAGLYDDAEAMMSLMESKGYASDNVIVHGYSLGGPIAAELVLRLDKQGKKVKGLVLDRAMVSSKKAGSAKSSIPGAGEMAKKVGRFSLKQKIELLPDDIKILFTYAGKKDELSAEDAKLASATLEKRGDDMIKIAKSENAGHFDHATMLNQMKDELRAMSQ